MFSSIVQILKINPVVSGISAKTKKPWERHSGEAALLDDSGEFESVGSLVLPPVLRGAVPGIYRAVFALYVPTFGENKGDISGRLTGLLPHAVKSSIPVPGSGAVAVGSSVGGLATVHILKVNEVARGVSASSGKPWERHTVECMLLDDSGVIECVGRLVLPVALREGVQRGVYRAGFGLVVPTYGDDKFDISAVLTSLVPVPALKAAFNAAAPKASAVSVVSV